jgi:hypothetical protein
MAAENELFIYLRYEAAQAEASSRAHHAGEQQRIRQTAQVQDTSEKEYLKAIKLRERAAKELLDSQLQGEKDFAAKQTELLNQVASLQKKLNRQELDDQKTVDQAIARSKQERLRAAQDTARALEEISKEIATADKNSQASVDAAFKRGLADQIRDLELAIAQKAGKRKADAAAELQELRERLAVGLSMSNEAAAAKEAIAKSENDLLRLQLKQGLDLSNDANARKVQSDKEAAAAKEAIAKEFAAADRRAEASLEADFKTTQRKLVGINKQAKQEMASDAKEAFDKWKKAHMETHQLTMMQWDQQQEATKKVESGIMGVAQAYTGLRIASLISQGIHQAMQAVGDAVKEANDHVKAMVDNMEKIRDTVQELASLRSKENGATFTAQIAREAEATGSTTQMHVAAQKTFLQYANQYVGTEGADAAKQAAEAKEGKTAFAETQELEQFAEISSNAQGINPSEGTRLMATILSQRKPGQTKDDLKLEWRKLAENMKQAAGPEGPLIGKLNELVMEEVGETGSLKTSQEAAVLLRGLSEANPAKGFTYGEAIIRGNREIRANKKGQMEELGITQNMTQEQMIIQAMKRSEEIAKEEGVDPVDVLARYYKDARGLRGMNAAINKGVKGGRFEAGRRDMANVTLAGAEKENRGYLAGEVGTKRRQEAASDRIDAAKSERYVSLREMQREFANRVKNSGKLDEPQGMVEQLQEKKLDVLYGNTRAERARDQMMGSEIEARLMQHAEGRQYMVEHNIGKAVGGRELGYSAAHDDKTMAESLAVLKSIERHSKAQVRQVNPALPGRPNVQAR